MPRRSGRLAICLAICAATAGAGGPPASRASLAFSRHAWQSADGLPEDFAQALTQTPDQYLWIGTSGGLARFDGARFTVFNMQNEPAFHDDSVYSLLSARDGALWIGTEGGGLICYRNGVFRAFGSSEGLSNGFVRVVFEDRDGKIWVGTDHGLYRFEGGSPVRVDKRNGIPRIAVYSVCQDRQGRILAGGTGLLVLDGSKAAYYRSDEAEADSNIRTIRETSDGAVWIGTVSGLRRLGHGITGNPFAASKIIRDTNVACLLESRSGALWIGTYGRGMIRYSGGQFVWFTAPAVLPHNNVVSIFEDAEDDVWVGTKGGLLRLSPSTAATITTADGAPQSINTIYQDPRGALLITALNGRLYRVTHQMLEPAPLPENLGKLAIRNAFRDSRGVLWLGTDGQGAVRWTSAGQQRFTVAQGLVNDFVRAFCEDRDGVIWIGTDGGLSRWSNGAFRNFRVRDGLAYDSIRALVPGRDGSLWIATDAGLSRFRDGSFLADPLLDRFRGMKVWAVYQDAQDSLWIGTRGAGLFLLKGGKLAQFTAGNGLPGNTIHFIVEDRLNRLWITGPAGVFSVARGDLEQQARDPSHNLTVRLFGTSDGLSTDQMSGGVQPAGAVGATGELWFPSAKGLVRIQPDALVQSKVPSVLIEQVLADGRPLPLASEILAGPGDGKMEIDYAAICLRRPERTRFRYRLEGFDRGWTDAGQRRTAYYTNLPAGRYTFRVVAFASNNPHQVSERSVAIRWRPHFYQTGWFLMLCGIVLATTAWTAFRLRVASIRKQFEAVLAERNRLAREMHDTLIQGCVGVSTVLEAASAAQGVSPQISVRLLDRARDEVRATVDEARLAVWNLRHSSGPGDLVSAAAQLAARFGREIGIPVKFEVLGSPLVVSAAASESLLTLVREALHNAIRHAAPRHLFVSLTFSRRALEIEIGDDGCGFDPSAGGSVDEYHYGMVGMRERASQLGGELHLTSCPGRGTTLRVRIPAKAMNRAADT